MFSYSTILKETYAIIRRRPLLWVFGMFVIGTFNLNFLAFQKWPGNFSGGFSPSYTLSYLVDHPDQLAWLSFGLLWAALLSFLLTNWARIMLLLSATAVLEKKQQGFFEQARQSKRFLWAVIKVSLLTSASMLGVLVVFIAPVWVENLSLQNVLWTLGAVIFLPLAFTISCINIFTAMFIVLLGMSVKKALDAGTDFFVSNWAGILGLSAILLVIYFAGFALGIGLLGLVKMIIRAGLIGSGEWKVLQFSPIFIIIKSLGVILVWILLGILNAFFNTALLLFFIKKITPIKSEDGKTVPETSPSPAMP